jgi:hypothetical protein
MANNHPGNHWFRTLIKSNRSLYQNSRKHTKLLIAKQVVLAVTQQRSPPGQFIKLITGYDGVVVGWTQMTFDQALSKTSQALREKGPSYTHPLTTNSRQLLNNKLYIYNTPIIMDNNLDNNMENKTSAQQQHPITDNSMNTAAISKSSKSSTCSGSGSGSGSDINTIDIAAASETSATNDNNNENNVVDDDGIIAGFSVEDIIIEPHVHVSRLLLLSDTVVMFLNL